MMSKIGLLGPRTIGYDADAAAYFAAMSVDPGTTRKGLINALIVGLKSDGLWTKISWLSLLASHDAQSARLSAKDPTKSFTAVNSPTFTMDRGYAGNGTTSYLDAGETLQAAGIYAQNSAFISHYVNVAGTGSYKTIGGAIGSGTPLGVIFVDSSSATIGYLNNTSTAASAAGATTGLFTASRTGSTTFSIYRGASSVGSDSTATTGVPSGTAGFAGRAGGSYTNDRQAVAAWGSGLSAMDVSNFNSRIVTYLTAIGAN